MRRILFLAPLALALSACAVLSPQKPRYVVFFQEWSAQIDPPARAAIDEAATWAKQHPAQTVQVRGFADAVGSPAANHGISGLRAQVVSDTMVADGVDRARIRRIAEGSIANSMDSQESRRVEIVFAAP